MLNGLDFANITFDWKDLDWLTLTIRVVQDNGITVVMGVDEKNKQFYVLDVKEDLS